MKILLAIDGSEFSDRAVQEVVHRPWPAITEVKIITVVEPMVTMMTETWVLPDKVNHRSRPAQIPCTVYAPTSNNRRSA